MTLKDSRRLKWYFALYRFIAAERLIKKDIDEREIHTVLVVVLSTGILMWAYAILAALTIASPIPGIVGFVASTTHLLSPVLYRWTNRTSIPTNVLLLSGAAHQGTFAFFTGGFESNILIWYGILPMIGGVCNGKKGVITWLLFTVVVSAFYFYLSETGFHYPHLITRIGFVWSQALLVFGWIFLSSTIVMVYVEMRKNTERKLHEQGQHIDELFRVLFHDLANPMGRIAIGLSIMKREGQQERGMEIAQHASESMMEITRNVRRMYAAKKGKASLDLELVPVNKAIEHILKTYETELEHKRLRIEYDKNCDCKVLVEPVSFSNQVLGNIVSNAIKFSLAEGEIKITTRYISPKNCLIEIKDHGIGIPQSLLNHLFDLNKKTSRPGTQGETGTGFGMHIMKTFVEMYGGTLEIKSSESGPDRGTTIKITLKTG